jgi:hypothetical protein
MQRIAICIGLFLALTPLARATPAWDNYNALLARQCPDRNVHFIPEDYYLALLNGFERTLSPSIRHAVRSHADIRHQCANEKMGFGCEMSRSLEAYRVMKLTHRFVAFACHSIRCEEGATCSQLPKARF